MLYHDEIHGDLFTQAEKTLDLLFTKYLKAGISYQGLQRLERFPMPEAALREAVINALIHKDYSSGTPIQISVYPDKLMLWNPGELPLHWTMAKFKGKHPSQPFNPDVANAFFRAGMIEAWGRGIERIMDACRAAHAPPPKLRFETSGLWVEFLFPADTPVETPGKTPGKTLGKTLTGILKLLQENPNLTVPEIAQQISKSESAVQRGILRLQIAGRLRRAGSRKSGHWEVLR